MQAFAVKVEDGGRWSVIKRRVWESITCDA